MHCLVVFANYVFQLHTENELPQCLATCWAMFEFGLKDYSVPCVMKAAIENQLSTFFRKIHFLLLAPGFWVLWNQFSNDFISSSVGTNQAICSTQHGTQIFLLMQCLLILTRFKKGIQSLGGWKHALYNIQYFNNHGNPLITFSFPFMEQKSLTKKKKKKTQLELHTILKVYSKEMSLLVNVQKVLQ